MTSYTDFLSVSACPPHSSLAFLSLPKQQRHLQTTTTPRRCSACDSSKEVLLERVSAGQERPTGWWYSQTKCIAAADSCTRQVSFSSQHASHAAMRCETNCWIPPLAMNVSAYKTMQVHCQPHLLKAIGAFPRQRLSVGFCTFRTSFEAVHEHNDFDCRCYARAIS